MVRKFLSLACVGLPLVFASSAIAQGGIHCDQNCRVVQGGFELFDGAVFVSVSDSQPVDEVVFENGILWLGGGGCVLTVTTARESYTEVRAGILAIQREMQLGDFQILPSHGDQSFSYTGTIGSRSLISVSFKSRGRDMLLSNTCERGGSGISYDVRSDR